MTDTPDPQQNSIHPMIYQIRLKGQLGPQWTEWFEELISISQDKGDTLLTGPVLDQAALYGLIKKVRDLGMTLISINQVEAGEPNAPSKISPHSKEF